VLQGRPAASLMDDLPTVDWPSYVEKTFIKRKEKNEYQENYVPLLMSQ